MAVPGFQELTLPVLRELADGRERTTREVRQSVAQKLGLSAAELAEILPSGRQARYVNRAAWAHVYLKEAGLLEAVRRGVYRITERGREVLRAPPQRIDIPFLMQFPEMQAFRSRGSTDDGDSPGRVTPPPPPGDLTPDEQIRNGYELLRESLATQLLARVQQASPQFFENLVVNLLVAMGYGGTQEDAAKVVGRSGDEGIDGIIKEDRLGLESIYLQAKRWDSNVGRPTIQQFAGALQGQRARKGVLITTSGFSRDAIEYARSLQTTIVLIDGPQLAELMIAYGLGVSTEETIKLQKLDEDYFAEE